MSEPIDVDAQIERLRQAVDEGDAILLGPDRVEALLDDYDRLRAVAEAAERVAHVSTVNVGCDCTRCEANKALRDALNEWKADR